MTALTREQVELMLAGATPGPWCVADETVVWTQINDPVETSYDIGYPVADMRMMQVQYGGKRWPEGQPKANATLCAAAPDLAAALLAAWDREAKLREALQDIADGMGETELVEIGRYAPAVARKALGETP